MNMMGTYEETDEKKHNRGSAVVEMTLLIPLFLGCIYFYIILLLFFVKQADTTYEEVLSMYGRADMNSIEITVEDNGLDARFNYKRNADDVVKKLRRWQLVADTIH